MQFFAILLAAAGLAAAAQVERVRRDDTYTQDVDFNNFCHLGENPKCCKSVVGQIVQSECDNVVTGFMPILNANDYKMACAEQGATAQCCFINNLNSDNAVGCRDMNDDDAN